MVLSSLSLIPLLILLLFTDLTTSSNENNYYLKLPLLHKNPSSSPSKTLFTDSTRLSTLFSTLNPQKTLKSPLVSGAPSGSGQYFVDFNIGTPPQKLLLVADTGSDLVWVKCSACRNCSTRLPGSAFLVRHSSTFSPFHCYDKACLNFPNSPQTPKIGRVCNRTRLHSVCRYEYTYGDESKTSGFFSREVTRLNTSSGKEAKLSNLAFGCGFKVSGPSITGASFNGANGVMGLGRGSISFSTQLGQRFGNKFSYCLMDYTLSPPPTSFLMIGKAHESEPVSKPIISRSNGSKHNLSFTPFQNNPTTNSTFYYVGIKSVIINGKSLRIDPSVWLFDEEGNGGTVIDSGTTLSFFAEPAYRHILTAVKHRVRYPLIDDPDQTFELCVNVSSSVNPSLPRLSFKLVGNSVFSPPSANYFIDTADGVKCLAIQPVTSQTGFSVIGNLMQQGFLFEFDREKSRLGFTRHGCSIP